MDDHRAAGLAGLGEAGAGEAFTARDQLVQPEALVGPRPPVVEERRLDLGHAGAVGIGLGRHVLAGVARRLNGGRGTGRSRRRPTSSRARCAAPRRRASPRRWSPAARRGRRACGCAPRRRLRRPHPEDPLDLGDRRARACRRCRARRPPRPAPGRPQHRLHRRDLRLGGGAAAADAGRQQPLARIAQHLHPRRDVPGPTRRSSRSARPRAAAYQAATSPVPTSSSNAEVTPSRTIIR